MSFELQFDWNLSVAVGLDFFGLRQGVKFQERVLVNVRIRVDRVHRNKGREQRRPARDAVDVIAFGVERTADASIDWRTDLRVFEIKLRGVQRRLRREQGGLGFLMARLASVRFFG